MSASVPEPPFRAVIFDMDGLMIDSERVYRLAWFAAIGEFGQVMTDEIFRRFLGRNATDARALLGELCAEFAAADFMRRGGELAFSRFAPEGMPPKPGLAELLDHLERAQLPKAIATSTRREAALRSLAGLEQRFDVLTTGEEITRGKPAPDIFLLAADRLRVAPADCLVLEDSEAGISAAHAAGMRAVLIPDLVEPGEAIRRLAWRVCRSLHEVRAFVPG